MIWIVTGLPKTRDELVPLVEAHGYATAHVDCVTNVTRRAKFRPPTLMILDCGIHGSFDLLGELRADPITQPIPVILFTTDEEQYRDEALARGADAFVPKRALDWAELFPEILRLAGPPRAAARAEEEREKSV